jgi:single-strand DNA-binding protein
MTIPTQTCLVGFIASTPELRFLGNSKARFYARIGVEHFRKEVDGSFTKLDPTFHDMVIFEKTAETAYAQLRKGDSFVASGHIHEYDGSRNGETVIREEFVARRIGHDMLRSKYEVARRQVESPGPVAAPAPQPAVGM